MAFFFCPFGMTKYKTGKDSTKMTKYFMGGTRLEGLERLMMDSSRSEHSPTSDVCREKGRYPQPSQPKNDQPPEPVGGATE